MNRQRTGIAATNHYRKPARKELTVLQLIHRRRNLSRVDLVELTGLSAGLITGITQDLIQKRLVTESRAESNSVGRRRSALSIRDDAAHVVGVDLGSYHLRVVVTDIVGNLVHQSRTETRLSEGREKVLSRTLSFIQQAISECGIPRKAIAGIGMAHSGIVDSASGLVLSYPRPGQMTEWKNVALREILQQEFSLPCLLEDSVRAIALAEHYFGFARDLDDFVYIDVGMGIGAGIFLNGKLYQGHGGGAGEFGHITVEENGPLCCCGNHGCLEMMASCAAVIDAARSAIVRGVDSKIRELVGGDLERVSIEIIADAAEKNDSLAFRVLHDAVSHIGVALADLVNLLNPGVVIFGGPLFRAGPYFLESLKRVIKQRALERSANQVQLRISNLQSEAGALGAARAISERVVEGLYQRTLVS